MASFQTLAIWILVSAVVVRAEDSTLCTSYRNHPLYSPTQTPVLIQCWSYMTMPKEPTTFYKVRHTQHEYAPMHEPSSNKYSSLDWFWASNGQGKTDDFVKLHFNRAARVYLLVPVHMYSDMESPSLPGWKAVEPVVLVKGDRRPLVFGTFQKYSVLSSLPQKMYVFYKDGSEVVLPHHSWVWGNLKGFKIPKMMPWIAMVAEKDGEVPRYPAQPSQISRQIRPNRRCPQALHDLWVTPNTDDSDADTRGKMWKTWHPLWDPIFWCTYSHEHGSSSLDLMGYYPKYDYTSWKNGRENESNEGFKNLIGRQNGYTFLYVVHVQTTSLRRVTERWHSIQLVIQDDRTKEIVAELTHKGDFGFLSVRGKQNTFIPISKEDAQLQTETFKAPKRRSINVITPGRFDPRYQYRNPVHSYMMGAYEDWTTVPLCGGAGRDGNLRLDITRSATGIRSISDLSSRIDLGYKENGAFFKQTGQARIFLAPKFKMSFADCERMLGPLPKDGVFYTDATGQALRSGPGRNAIRQYVKPGFHATLMGEFRAVDSWTVLMKKDSKGEMKDIGFGLDPRRN